MVGRAALLRRRGRAAARPYLEMWLHLLLKCSKSNEIDRKMGPFLVALEPLQIGGIRHAVGCRPFKWVAHAMLLVAVYLLVAIWIRQSNLMPINVFLSC